jgi:hypothetical protein
MLEQPQLIRRKGAILSALFPLILVAAMGVLALPSPVAAQAVSELEPPQNVHKNEGETVLFACTVEGIPLADITSVTLRLHYNDGTNYDNVSLSHAGAVTKGERFEGYYTIPFDYLENSGHQNLKWNIQVDYTGGTIYGPGSGQHVIHVHEASPVTYDINCVFSPTAGGTVTSTNPVTGLTSGDNVTFNYTLNPGWEITSVTFNTGGSESHTNSSVTVTGTTNGGTVTINVAQIDYTVNCVFSPTGGGTVTPPNPVTGLHYGDDVTFYFTVNPGWTVTGATTTSGGTVNLFAARVTVRNITNSGTVTITATQDNYTVNCVINPTEGGTVTSTNPVTNLHYGDNVTFNFSLNSGWSVTGATTTSGGTVSLGSGSVTVTGITNSGTVTVNVQQAPPPTYTVNAVFANPSAGTVTSTNPVTGLHAGDNVTFNFTLNAGWSVTGATTTSGGTVSFTQTSVTVTGITGDGTVTINAIYTPDTYTVNAIFANPAAGTVTSTNPVTGLNAGDNVTFNFTLNTNYYITSVTTTSGGTVSYSSSSVTVTGITGNGTVTIYTAETILGSLVVYLEPSAELLGAGAWKIDGLGGWRKSGDVVTDMNPGVYWIDFLDVDGWKTPKPITVEIFRGKLTEAVVYYVREGVEVGDLQVFIVDNQWQLVIKEGALWRPTGSGFGDHWYHSGDIIYNIPVGTIGLEFLLVPGYILPDLGSADIKPNILNVYTGEYIRPLIVHKADYNGDGTDDLGLFDDIKGKWLIASISKPGKKGVSAAAYTILRKKFGKKYDIPVPGDYNGDGKADLAYYRETTGEWSVLKQFKLEDFGQYRDIPVPGDYNGDGRTDPALFRPTTGEWFLYDVDTQKTTTVKFGKPGDVPVPGNYNGDAAGWTDLGIFNVISGDWRVAIYNVKKEKWIVTKKLRKPTKKMLSVSYGEIGDIPMQADYDGDGTTDHAVYVRGNSAWKIMNQYELEFGNRDMIPVPNDWAGLGRVIPAMFDPKTGKWSAVDDLLSTKFGKKAGLPLMSGR